MPKNRKVIKTSAGIKKLNAPRKLRIGTRSGGVSAHTMSSDALKAVLNDTGKSKYHTIAGRVLSLRGITFEWPTKLLKEASLVSDFSNADSAGGSAA